MEKKGNLLKVNTTETATKTMMEMRNVKRRPQSVRPTVSHTLCGPRGKRTESEVTTLANMRYAVGQTAYGKRKFDSGPLNQTVFVLTLNINIMYTDNCTICICV